MWLDGMGLNGIRLDWIGYDRIGLDVVGLACSMLISVHAERINGPMTEISVACKKCVFLQTCEYPIIVNDIVEINSCKTMLVRLPPTRKNFNWSCCSRVACD